MPFLKVDQADDRQTLFQIVDIPDREAPSLSRLFEEACRAKQNGLLDDFSFFEPSLHHMFIALSAQAEQQ